MIMVRLSREDEVIAHTAGLARESRYGSNPKFLGNKGNFHNAVVIHSEAVGAEMAVARYFGVADFVPTVNTFKNEPDVYWNGVAIEVKQTPHKRGHLIISEDDRDTDIAVLGRRRITDLLRHGLDSSGRCKAAKVPICPRRLLGQSNQSATY
jgi:hypothetical protein